MPSLPILLLFLALTSGSLAQTREYTSLPTLLEEAIRKGDEHIQYRATLPLDKPESISPERLTQAYPELRSYWQDTFFVLPVNLNLTIMTDNPEYILEFRDIPVQKP